MLKKIVCLSDLHEQQKKVVVPEGDILLIAGDLTFLGKPEAIIEFNNWLGEIEDKFSDGIAIIAGNHDWLFQEDPEYAKSLITNADYLEDSFVNIGGFKIWGTPWQPWFHDWAFNADPQDRKEKWDLIPNDTDILIVHGPPYEYGDETYDGRKVGCDLLRYKIEEIGTIKLVVTGHIHESYGTYKLGETLIVNASTCTTGYKPTNKPIIVELDNEVS